ncbi:MAG: oligosaccharide flippase family protein [Paracoccus hibiscisoli]|uniref:oligosaccharide flippase family protein n=1 Tax=Paracoccus hibiscisoli TaxID=2023261 RepID=UPI00391AD67E
MTGHIASHRAGFLAVAAKLGGAGLGIAANVILARLMGPEQFGQYALGFALASVVVVLASGGMPFGAVRFVPRYLTGGDLAAMRRFCRTSLIVTAIGGIICAAAMVMLARLLDPGHLMAAVLPWAALMVVPAALAQSLAALLQGRGHVAGPEIVQSLVRQGVMLGLIGAWVVLGGGVQFRSALMISAIAVGLAALVLGLHLARLARADVPLAGAGAHSDDGLRTWLGAGGGLLVILVMAALNERVDLFVLGWLGTPADLGIYSAAVRIASVAILALAGLGAAYTPRIAAAWSRRDLPEVERLCREASLAGTALTVAMTLGAVLFGGAVLSLFGGQFRAGATVLTILLAGQVLVGMMGIAGGLAIIAGRSRIALTGVAAGLAVNALSGIVLVPHWGMTGAAIGVVLGFALSQAIIALWCSLALGVRATLLPVGRPVALAAAEARHA